MPTRNEQLAMLLQGLPQELYDEIYSLTFTATAGDDIEVTPSLKAPSSLQVDRATRALATTSYYANIFFCKDQQLLDKWLDSLPRQHLQKLREVRYEIHHESHEFEAARGRFPLSSFLPGSSPWGGLSGKYFRMDFCTRLRHVDVEWLKVRCWTWGGRPWEWYGGWIEDWRERRPISYGTGEQGWYFYTEYGVMFEKKRYLDE